MLTHAAAAGRWVGSGYRSPCDVHVKFAQHQGGSPLPCHEAYRRSSQRPAQLKPRVRMHRLSSAYVSIRQHTSACSGYASAYVSHTLACDDAYRRSSQGPAQSMPDSTLEVIEVMPQRMPPRSKVLKMLRCSMPCMQSAAKQQ
jgi:hypothetical protein